MDMSGHGCQREEIEATEELIRKLRESAERLSVINSGRHTMFNVMKTVAQTRDSFIKNYGVMLSNGYDPSVEELASVDLLSTGLDVYLNFYKMAKMRDLMFVRTIMEMEIPRFSVTPMRRPYTAGMSDVCYTGVPMVNESKHYNIDAFPCAIIGDKDDGPGSGIQFSASEEPEAVMARTFKWRSPYSLTEDESDESTDSMD